MIRWLLDDGLAALGGLVCHQLPARSWWLGGLPLPLCARCTGLYLGGLGAALVWLWLRPWTTRATPPRVAWLTAGVLLLLTPLEASCGTFRGSGLGPAGRLLLASLTGAALAWLSGWSVVLRLRPAGGWRVAPGASVGTERPRALLTWAPLLAGGLTGLGVLWLIRVASSWPPWPGAMARWTLGLAAAAGILLHVLLWCGAGAAWLLPDRLRRTAGPWLFLTATACGVTWLVLAILPGEYRSPFYWIRLLW